MEREMSLYLQKKQKTLFKRMKSDQDRRTSLAVCFLEQKQLNNVLIE